MGNSHHRKTSSASNGRQLEGVVTPYVRLGAGSLRRSDRGSWSGGHGGRGWRGGGLGGTQGECFRIVDDAREEVYAELVGGNDALARVVDGLEDSGDVEGQRLLALLEVGVHLGLDLDDHLVRRGSRVDALVIILQ